MITFPRGTDMDRIFGFLEYNDKVMDYLEYLGYPELVQEFEPNEVAASIAGANKTFYDAGISIRMAALANFGLTWTMQIVRQSKNLKVN